jgi:hypothetical protein
MPGGRYFHGFFKEKMQGNKNNFRQSTIG